MSTISSMARNNYLMLQYAQRTGNSLWKAASASGLSRTSYASYGSAAASSLSGLMGLRSGLGSVMQTYETTSKAFRAEFGTAMDGLSQSATALKKMDFDVGGEAALTTTIHADGRSTVSKSAALTDVLKGIEDFAAKYNDAVDFFQDNANVSQRMKLMGTVFADTSYRASSLAAIGIVTAADGKMKIDEDVLTDALVHAPSKVERTLGKGGLADRAERHVALARSQQERLLPAANALLGTSSFSGSTYSARNLARLSSYAMMGNFLSLYV